MARKIDIFRMFDKLDRIQNKYKAEQLKIEQEKERKRLLSPLEREIEDEILKLLPKK